MPSARLRPYRSTLAMEMERFKVPFSMPWEFSQIAEVLRADLLPVISTATERLILPLATPHPVTSQSFLATATELSETSIACRQGAAPFALSQQTSTESAGLI